MKWRSSSIIILITEDFNFFMTFIITLILGIVLFWIYPFFLIIEVVWLKYSYILLGDKGIFFLTTLLVIELIIIILICRQIALNRFLFWYRHRHRHRRFIKLILLTKLLWKLALKIILNFLRIIKVIGNIFLCWREVWYFLIIALIQ